MKSRLQDLKEAREKELGEIKAKALGSISPLSATDGEILRLLIVWYSSGNIGPYKEFKKALEAVVKTMLDRSV